MKKILIIGIILCLVASNILVIGAATATSSEKIPVIIGFKDRPNPGLVHASGGSIKYEYNIIPAIACSLPQQAIDALKKNPNIAYIEQDIQISATDVELDNSWGVKHIGAGTVHLSGNRGTGIKVAVLDTGINYNHEELIAAYKGGFDFINNDPDPFDDNGHGTHCAGIIAAADNDNNVLVGVAPQVSLYSAKVLGSTGSGSLSTIIAGIQWATNNKMQVISMSLGASTGTVSLQQACDAAYANNIVVVAAAGNNGAAFPISGSNINYPARYSSVIAVGATGSNDVRASFSCTGSQLELVAPGVNILSTYKDVSPTDQRNIDTVYMSGTSMATPHVAGVAALMLASPIDQLYDSDHDGVWDASEVRTKLQATAKDLGTSGKDNLYGYGLVDAVKATTGSVDTTAPIVTGLTPADGAFVNIAAPTISGTVSDATGVNWASLSITVDSNSPAIPTIDIPTGKISYQPTTLSEGIHTVSLAVADTLANTATKTWSFTVDTSAPTQVTGLIVTKVTSNGVDLTWTINEGATKYNIYRDGTIVATTTTNSYSDTGLSATTTYEYFVTALDSAGNQGTPSETVSATTSSAPTMHVESITMELKTSGLNTYATATIKVVDSNHNPLSGAKVTGTWSIATRDVDTAITNTDGNVVLQSNNVRRASGGTTFTITVNGVVLAPYIYDSSIGVTSNTIIKK